MTHETLSDFLIAATPPRDGHASGTLEVAESIQAASAWRVPFPSGYDEVDALLASARSRRGP